MENLDDISSQFLTINEYSINIIKENKKKKVDPLYFLLDCYI